MTNTVNLPWTRPPLTGNDRGHTKYRSTAVKTTLNEARAAIRGTGLTPTTGVHVTLHWRINTRHRRDPDNLAPTLKECLDALVHEHVLPDDSWAHVHRASCVIHPPNGEPAHMWLEIATTEQDHP